MKLRCGAFLHTFLSVTFASIPLSPTGAHSQTLYWASPADDATGLRNGTWDLTTANWSSSSSGLPTQTWANANGSTAQILGKGGLITLDGGVVVNRVVSNNTLFELTGQPLLLVGSNPTITGSLTIRSELVATSGSLQFAGTGNISVYSLIRSAQVNNSSRQLSLSAGALQPTTSLTNSSSSAIVLLGDQTVSKFTGTANFGGTGAMTAANGFKITGGTTSGQVELLGNIEVNGQYFMSKGSTGSGLLKVNTGWFYHGGVSTNASLDIASGANFAVWHLGADLDPGLRGLSPDAVVTNSGNLQMDYNDAVARYTQTNGRLTGSGVLGVSAGAELFGGMIAGNLSGETSSHGEVLVSGKVGGGSLNVNDGTLTLSGTAINPTIIISGTAKLIDQNGGIGDEVSITNSGQLVMQADDTVGSFQQNQGVLAGTGTLTVADKASVSGSITGTLSGKVEAFAPLKVEGTISGASFSLHSDATVGAFGKIISDHIAVGEGSTLDVRSYNQAFSTSATIENSGIVHIERPNWVSRYIQEGAALLDGAPDGGNLVATDGITLRGGVVNASIMGNLEIDGGHTQINRYFGGGAFTMRAGTLQVENNGISVADVSSFLQLDGVIQGDKTFIATGDAELRGGFLGANLSSANIRTSGNVEVSGYLFGNDVTYTFPGPMFSPSGILHVMSGTLTMSGGGINNALVRIEKYASLVSRSDFTPSVVLQNNGTLTMETDNSIQELTNNAGIVRGRGRLTVLGSLIANGGELAGAIEAQSGAALRDGTLVSGELFGQIRTDGDVTISGTVGGDLHLASGSLTVTGSVESFVHIHDGISLIGNGRIKGNLLNEGSLRTLSQGERTLVIDGGLANQGTISMAVTDAGHHDQIQATGTASLGGDLVVTNSGDGLAAGEIVRLITAGEIHGSFNRFDAVGFANGVLFDNATGRLVGMGGGQAGSASAYMNLNESQTDVYFSLYDDAIGDGERNVITDEDTSSKSVGREMKASASDSVTFTVGLPDGPAALVDALNIASFTDPGAIFQPVINRLSPEVHRGMADYTELSLRNHGRQGMDAAPMAASGKTRVFAVTHTSSDGVDSGQTDAGYDLQFSGVTAGLRYDLDPRLQIGGWFGGDIGEIQGELIDTNAHGLAIGIFGRYLAHQETQTNLTAGISCGTFDFDAERHSFLGDVASDDVGSDAVELMLGARSTIYQKFGLRVMPNAAVRYLGGTVEGFTESGSGVALDVGGQDIESLMLEVGVDADYRLLERVILSGNIGYVSDLGDSGDSINAAFAASGAFARPFSVFAPGIDDDGVAVGMGLSYDFSETMRANFGYRGDFRFDAENAHAFHVGLSVGF